MSKILFWNTKKRFQAGQDRIERKMEKVIIRLGNLEISVTGLRRDFAHVEENAASMRVRYDMSLSPCTYYKLVS